MHHSHVYQDQEYMHHTSYSQNRLVRSSVRPLVPKKYRIIDTCTTHTCMLQDQGPGSQICASYTHASESRSRIIDMCIIHTCSIVKDQGTQIDASYMYVSGSRTEDHRYVHHTHMHQSQGSRNIDKYIIHGCIRIMYPTPRIALFVRLLVGW